MAELSVIPGGAPAVVDQVLLIPVDQVEVKDRLRPLDPVWAKALAGIMKAEGGQRAPILVSRLPGKTNWRLVAGLHRLEACRINGEPVRAVVLDTADKLARVEAEISENFFRRDLSPIDRAAFVAELHEVLRAKAGVQGEAGRSISAQVRWQKELKKQAADASGAVTLAYGFAEGVAADLGLSRETIYRDLALHKGLRPDIADKLRGHPIAGNAGQLRALAKLSHSHQWTASELILRGKVKGVSEALATMRQAPKPDPDPDTKHWNAFFGAWSRMSARKRAEALRELAAQGLPKGFSLSEPGDD